MIIPRSLTVIAIGGGRSYGEGDAQIEGAIRLDREIEGRGKEKTGPPTEIQLAKLDGDESTTEIRSLPRVHEGKGPSRQGYIQDD